MTTRILRSFAMTLITASVFAAQPAQSAKIRIVATLTDLADFARNVGGDLVEVRSLATGVEDTHGVPLKPSFVPLMNRADLLILIGLECEHAFLPALLEASKNPRIQIGTPGYVDCSKGIAPLEVPRSTERSEGDVHPYGNPHYMLDPLLAKMAIGNIFDALVAFAPEHQAVFVRNRDAYLAKLDAKIAEWQEEAKVLRGVPFVSYHLQWPYFADRFGMVYSGTIELKPGIDPTPRHIEQLIASMQAERVPIVIREPQFPEKVPARVAAQTGAKLIKLPIMPGGVPQTGTYIDMMELYHPYFGRGCIEMRRRKGCQNMPDAGAPGAAASGSVITLEDLGIGFGPEPVLSGISLSIARSSFTAIVGVNGSGKTTLLKTLLGLLPPVAGCLRICAPGDVPLIFGYVPQSAQLDPIYPLSGFDVALMGTYGRVGPGRRVPRAERAFVWECLRAAAADAFAPKRFSLLSGGQKQRVLIARALAAKPDILVLDEPTADVDAAATHALMEFISRIHLERKLTILLASHDLALVRRRAQQVIWLHRGRVLQGPAAELLTPERMAEIFEMEAS